MPKPILIGISPNTESDDVWLAGRTILTPSRWLKGPNSAELAGRLKHYFDRDYCYLVNAGRTALWLGLYALKLRPGDEVIHLDFTCAVVPEAIIKAGGKPVGVKDLTKIKPSAKTKAVIIQHTFGVPDDLDKITAICRKHNLTLIEDLAHSLGAKYQGKPVGGFGDQTVLSFGRDKIISSVFGGALLSKKSLVLPKLDYPGRGWIFKQLFHPLLMAVAVPTYFYGGKVLIYLSRILGLITLPLANVEPAFLPEALATLALHQWKKLDYLNNHRQELARFYAHELKLPFDPSGIYLRYPMFVKKPLQLIKAAKAKQMLLGNWYDNKIINLPTHIKIDLSDAQRIVNFVKNYVIA